MVKQPSATLDAIDTSICINVKLFFNSNNLEPGIVKVNASIFFDFPRSGEDGVILLFVSSVTFSSSEFSDLPKMLFLIPINI